MGTKSVRSNRFSEQAIQRDRLIAAAGLLVLVAIVGTAGFKVIEDWPLWKCFYFTVVTISTVGYGDEGISVNGAKFATLLLIFGIGAASYAFSVLVQYTMNRGSVWRKRMQKQVNKLQDHVIIVGFGRMGQFLCEELAREDHGFVVVESDAARAKQAIESGYLVVEGSAGEDEFLEKAGIDKAKHLVTLASQFERNIVVALTAKELSSELNVIARAESNSEERKLIRAGANQVISPFHSGSSTISKMITHPRVAEFLSSQGTVHSNVVLAEVKIESDSGLIGKSLREFGEKTVPHVCFVALERGTNEVMIPPRGNEEFCADDLLIVAGDPNEISTMKKSGQKDAGLTAFMKKSRPGVEPVESI